MILEGVSLGLGEGEGGGKFRAPPTLCMNPDLVTQVDNVVTVLLTDLRSHGDLSC